MKTAAPDFLRNGDVVPLAQIPDLSPNEFRDQILQSCERKGRIMALFGQPGDTDNVRLFVVLADDAEGQLKLYSTVVSGRYIALTPACAQAHWFEREIAEQWGIVPEGHPWLKPIRFHKSYRDSGTGVLPVCFDNSRVVKLETHSGDTRATSTRPGVANFFAMAGDEVHEVAVGPVHAGIIEPGHFRFQCHGEQVYHLEISLGYQHRGIERALIGGLNKRTIPYMETLAGDTTIGHTLAYCEAIEALAGCRVPARAQALRAVALELERLANHTGDLGALAGDIGYLPTASFCGRVRGDFLNMTALICGNRFGRGLVRPGGVLFDLDENRQRQLEERLSQARADVVNAVKLLWDAPSVRSRFENAGPLSRETALDLGLVGVAARACGVERDVRVQFPSGIYRFAQIPMSSYHTGNVFARAQVRWMEIQRSLAFVLDQLQALPNGSECADIAGVPASCLQAWADKMSALPTNHAVVTLVEGWRGEICHVALTDGAGKFTRYKVVDPSFHNWMGLAMALRDQQISDFPLCNKSFNLSYCGHDL